MIALFIFLYIVVGVLFTIAAFRFAPEHSFIDPNDWIIDDDPGEIGFAALFFIALWPFFILVCGIGILFKKARRNL